MSFIGSLMCYTKYKCNYYYNITKVWLSLGLRTYTGRLSFLRIPEEKVKEAASSDKYIEIQIQDIANGNDEHNDKKYTNNFDCNSNFSFDMDSISLDTGCNQVRHVYIFYKWLKIFRIFTIYLIIAFAVR